MTVNDLLQFRTAVHMLFSIVGVENPDEFKKEFVERGRQVLGSLSSLDLALATEESKMVSFDAKTEKMAKEYIQWTLQQFKEKMDKGNW